MYVEIELKYVKIQHAEFHIEGQHFSFYLKPYLLQLTMPGPVLEYDPRTRSTYDIDNNLLTCALTKANQGEDFHNLNMISLLMSKPPPDKPANPLIEVMDEPTDIPQLEEEFKALSLSSSFAYGFQNRHSGAAGIFKARAEEIHEIADLNPE